MSRVRVTLEDTKDTDDKRLNKLLKAWKGSHGWINRGVVPLADQGATPVEVAERLVQLLPCPGGWRVWLAAPSGSLVAILATVRSPCCKEEAEGERRRCINYVAVLLEWGARLGLAGELEVTT